ncbi:MAG TPA: DNA repair protein RecN [Flavitalea sp.]|nr:DNA repair protein RecN [Flavitalea sp.]
MLKRLHIQNYAIIDEIEIDFTGNLSVITGETGAGKSILMGALSLILGDRADTAVLLNREKKCVVEGSFSIDDNLTVRSFIEEEGLDGDNEVVIRREIAVSGKSRAFVNDTPVNLEQLRRLSGLMVDLHRQFDVHELGDKNFQLEVLDALAGNRELSEKYNSIFSKLKVVTNDVNALVDQKTVFEKEVGYNQFLFDELNEASFQPEELEQLDQELKLLTNSESLKAALTKTGYDLTESDDAVIRNLKSVQQQLIPYSSFHPVIQSVLDRVHSTQIELADIANELEQLNNHLQYDAKRIESIDERISTGYRLLKKHAVRTTNDLIKIHEILKHKLEEVFTIDDLIAEKRKEMDLLMTEARSIAMELSVKRKKVSSAFEKNVNQLLVQVGMPNAQIRVVATQIEMNRFGIDAVEFLFDANKSNRFESIQRVASGGELSRLMLCIKSLIAETVNLPTLIFDEIDTGISGEAARQVGLIMKQLAASRQVICITHQPQIAGKASSHYFVYKEIRKDNIHTGIRLLTQEERIFAIAKMLSGEKPTNAAIENAREMVMN